MDQEQTPQERALELVRWLLPNSRPSDEQVLWAIRIAIAVAIVLGLLALIGNLFGITLWDWIKVLAVPITVGVAVPFLNRAQQKRAEKLALQRSHDDALEGYLNQISQLLTDQAHPLQRCLPGDKLTVVARSRTLTVLAKVDGGHKGRVVQFLYEAGLILDDTGVFGLNGADLQGIALETANLSHADLLEADLKDAQLPGADLSKTNLRRVHLENANLTGAKLRSANLRGANLRSAELYGAFLMQSDISGATLTEADLRRCVLREVNLFGTYLTDTNLREAKLSGADLKWAKLSGADLKWAKLTNADLSYADLSGADLRHADMSGARGWTMEQLTTAKSLEGATMPDGQTLKSDNMPHGPTFEEWLKDKDALGKNRGEGGPS